MRLRQAAALAAAMPLMAAEPAIAHFQVLQPSRDSVGGELTAGGAADGLVGLDLVFTHPMQRGPAMAMPRPARFGVLHDGRVEDLLSLLEARSVDGQPAWRAAYRIRQPGDYVFFVAPQPYWEPAERQWIVHYAKVVVDGYGAGDGWDRLVGLPVEIQPLVRPYGLWTGNVFRGVVLQDGKPLPGAEVEVEWLNDGSLPAPPEPFVTQVIKADAAGTFTYAMPRAGWWGFAALVTAAEPRPAPDGKPAAVELGGVMWVRAVDMR